MENNLSQEIRLYACELLLGLIVKIAPIKSYEGNLLIRYIKSYFHYVISELKIDEVKEKWQVYI
jgi:hypothetical protein